MKPEAQRIAIAEACGWKRSIDADLPTGQMLADFLDATFPDYLNDLNAMHEAEKVLTEEQIETYCVLLFDVTGGPAWKVILSTSAQRAEAFLRTLGLWVEETT
jgi:hypothetical protein